MTLSPWLANVPANIVALSGIAIAIGTIAGHGVILCENILKHLDYASEKESKIDVVFRACSEVGGAVTTAVATTVISFLPVLSMEAAEGNFLNHWLTPRPKIGNYYRPIVIPLFAHMLFTMKSDTKRWQNIIYGLMALGGAVMGYLVSPLAGNFSPVCFIKV